MAKANFSTDYLNAPIFNPLKISVQNVQGLADNLSDGSLESPDQSAKEKISLSTVI